MTDTYIYLITALLPLSALMVVLQVNPYQALVLRGILGAVAALVYSLLGAADVALTEALVGTMLAITLYAVAVRSSLVMRIGVLNNQKEESDRPFAQLIAQFRTILQKHHLRLELVAYQDQQTLSQGLLNKEIHATCTLAPQGEPQPVYQTVIRIERLYEIIQAELNPSVTSLSYTREINQAFPNPKEAKKP